MVVVGWLVGTFEPAREMVAIAQASSASARANTIAPSQAAGTTAGTNGKGMSQSSANPASAATAHAIGGRIMTFAVSVAAAMAGLLKLAPEAAVALKIREETRIWHRGWFPTEEAHAPRRFKG